MPFVLSSRSLHNLVGVHPALADTVERAITFTTQDFTVVEGLRSLSRQREYVARGVSRTLASKHLAQDDGLGHAVDLVPWIDGTLRWEWPPIYHIAAAMQSASDDIGLSLVWGGVWDRTLNELPTGPDNLRAAVLSYQARHPGPDFIDGPHFQLA